VRRWEELLRKRDASDKAVPKGGHQPADKGLSKTARLLGLSREAVRRSRAVASLSRKAQKAAKALGLDDNEAALVKAAKEPTPKAQAKKVHELAKKNRKRSASLSPKEVKQLKALRRAFAPGSDFTSVWNATSVAVRQKFVKSALKPTRKLSETSADDDEW
jgi:Skp family chaperone for outer membrane proteins